MMKRLFWDLYALSYDGLNDLHPYQQMLTRIVGLLNLKGSEHVLDAGCGTGNAEKIIATHSGIPRITALDFSNAMLRRAKKKNSDKHIGFYKADLNEKLEFKDQVFDKVLCINMLYNLKDPETALREFLRVLKPGGILIVVTPRQGAQLPLILKAHRHSHEPDHVWQTESLSGWFRFILRAFGFSSTTLKFIFIALCNKSLYPTMRMFTQEDLEKLLLKIGFTIINIERTYANQNLLFVVKKQPK